MNQARNLFSVKKEFEGASVTLQEPPDPQEAFLLTTSDGGEDLTISVSFPEVVAMHAALGELIKHLTTQPNPRAE